MTKINPDAVSGVELEATLGASLGSIVPLLGTAIGAATGAVLYARSEDWFRFPQPEHKTGFQTACIPLIHIRISGFFGSCSLRRC